MCKISIIIPVYNVEDYIEETLISIKNQTMKDYEVILVDDGSTDKSVQIIEKYINENIKLIKQENSGPSCARNKGLGLAKGDYIAFMDSDDTIPEDSLEIRYKLAIENNAEIVIGGTYKFDGKDQWPMQNHFLSEGIKDIRNDYDMLKTLGPCNKLFKRSLIENIKFPENIKYAEDQVFVMEAYLKAKNIYASKNVVYFYRVRPEEAEGSLTKQIINKSDFVIKQVNESWSRTLKNIETYCKNEYEKDMLSLKYFERLLDYDIWPPLKNAVIRGEENVKINALKNMNEILKEIDPIIINNSRKLRWIMGQGIINKYLFLTKNTKKIYVEILADFYNKFNSNSKEILEKENIQLYKCLENVSKSRSSLSIFKYLVRRRLGRVLGKVKNIFRRSAKISFNLGKMLSMNENLVILASNKGEELQGNLKFIYDELKKDSKYKIKLYMKNDSRNFKELVDMYLDFSRAKYIVLDDYYRQIYGLKFRKKAEVIQVWHACGAFKKFGFSSIGKGDGNPKEFEERAHSAYTKVITSSKNIIPKYAEAFNISEKNILPLGVPRTDILLDEAYRLYKKNDLEENYPEIKGKKIILYAPTFRGNTKQRQNFKLELNPVQLLKGISEDYVLILKLHPSVKNGINDVVIPKELENRVINMNSSTEINDLIIASEIVITDYSSVVFEASLLEKKIIMYAYDKNEYLAERDFYYDYDSFVPGIIAEKNEDIIRIINENEFDLKKVREFRDKFFDDCDGQASKRFVETIFK
ncbi:bifunctional glycosyltransferase/CDP-glycerol:glycerophosphate glycerophosphotransferase [Clostridium thermobutyricum]|uniref:bifunctional glycosyltransferase/CDP-glycerol:glycerophosphate glycerophosphotransferase n=1 Tax=Clostridium thermobutyricum TaxID=29372 RepID=UPI0018ABC098|nr:CDP-glycerol glycerophosphotransferase family protein [Clostridium thermobutyricum]